MKVMLYTYDKVWDCQNNYIRTFADWDELKWHIRRSERNGIQVKTIDLL